jgi:CheY-like chemotaxis protein
MYILIHNSNGSFSIDLPESFNQINIVSIYSSEEENDYLYKNNKEEYFFNKVSESLDNSSYSNVKAIIIDKNLGGSGWSRAIGLASHIACTDYSKCALNKIPIILSDWTDLDLEDQSLKDNVINNIFQTEGFYFRKYEAIFSVKLDKLSGLMNYAIDVEVKKLKPVLIDKINISSPYDNRHQTTNEWGAMRLASNFGIFELIKFTYPKHLYFKYLSRFINQGHLDPNKSLQNLFSKILLIDDNADCGWIELLKNIHFEFDDLEKGFKGKIDKITTTDILNVWKNVTPEKFNQYDLIYLDLYLEKGKADSTNALSALKFIKEKYPNIPIIIFTASDKAWNLDEVLEKGADAMYIKESPLYYRNKVYSLKNYSDFMATINFIHKKYIVLRPYWLAIQEILTDKTFLNLTEKGNSKFKERIKERLEMFYGLLKRGLEQTEFNESRFHFSDHELAFVILWSILNEISEANFRKTQPSISINNSAGIQFNTHPSGRSITYLQNHFKWVIINQEETFIEYEYNLRFDLNGNPLITDNGRSYILTHEQKSCFEFSKDIFQIIPSAKTKPNYETTLFLQIAYLLERKNNLSSSINKFHFQETLVRLNEIRNHLYLTHGSDISSGFYDHIEKDKRATHLIKPDKDLKDLFELISFLLTGNENKVNI